MCHKSVLAVGEQLKSYDNDNTEVVIIGRCKPHHGIADFSGGCFVQQSYCSDTFRSEKRKLKNLLLSDNDDLQEVVKGNWSCIGDSKFKLKFF